MEALNRLKPGHRARFHFTEKSAKVLEAEQGWRDFFITSGETELAYSFSSTSQPCGAIRN